MTLPALMAMTVVGSGLGLYLGKSAIGEINPVYYSSPSSASRFHADLVPNRPDGSASVADLQNAALTTGLGRGCVGCRTFPEEYFPAPDPAIESNAAFEPVAAQQIIADVDREIVDIARRAELETVQRYAHYPISSDDLSEGRGTVRVAYGTPPAEAPASTGGDGCAPGESCAGAPAPGI